jgi:L-histidine N-alpha-methyltransferase
MGNFTPTEQITFLKKVSPLLKQNDRFLIGLDLVKDSKEIEAAYNDSAGITESFNKNILNVINNHLQGNFRLDLFEHSAFFNPSEHRIEMHLVSSVDQQVDIQSLNLSLPFQRNESIWTESSHKFTRGQVQEMLSSVGMELVDWFQDKEGKFALVLAGIS